MQVWNAGNDTIGRLIDETRTLFILKRAATAGGPSLEWTKRSAYLLSRSANPAIAAEARRVDYSLDLPRRRQCRSLVDAHDSVLWVAFPRA